AALVMFSTSWQLVVRQRNTRSRRYRSGTDTKRMIFMTKRASGILLHPTSLPSPYGIGDLGAEARAFIDFLHKAGQSFWQILPLTPTGYGDSPYQSISAFAGNTLLIDPRSLFADGLLDSTEISAESVCSDQVDFNDARLVKTKLLHQAYDNFRQNSVCAV